MKDEELDALIASTPEPASSGAHVDDAALLAYVRRALPDEESASVEKHLIGCPDCRALAEGFAIGPSAELVARVKQPMKAAPFSRARIAGAVGIAAAAAVLFFVAVPRGEQTLPHFAIEGPFGGVQAVRTAQDASDTFDANSRLEVIFRPTTAAPAVELEVRAGKIGAPPVRVQGGEVQRGDTGALIYRAPAPVIFSSGRGTYAVVFELSSPGSAPARFELELSYLGEKEQP